MLPEAPAAHNCGMTTPTPGLVRLATPADHEAIHALNYRTFVEEIPQHAPDASRRLVDRFHDTNVYAVYEVEGQVVGMVCGRPQRPFSLDQKLGPVDQWLPPGCTPVEIRLLAVEPAYRATRVFVKLARFITEHFMHHGYDVAVISGTTRQLSLYRHMGFTPFGHRIGTADAEYQPMFITRHAVQQWPAALASGGTAHGRGGNFHSGPVGMKPVVVAAMAREAASHRADRFLTTYQDVQSRLCALTRARHATLLLGSGTLANDVVGAQLLQLESCGVVVSNGEFGDRLVDHAVRLGLPHVVVRAPWGAPLNVDELEAAMITTRARWLWAVHTETSTGVVNHLDRLRTLAQRHRAHLALDAVSSVGAFPVQLDGVWCASAVSGKALASFPGVAIVLHDTLPATPNVRVPRYLDLHLAAASSGVPFTQSSNLLDALHASLTQTDWPARIAQRAHDGRWLRSALEAAGLRVLAPTESASPIVHTIPLPAAVSAIDVGLNLRARGWQVGFESSYLRARNWLQLCLMGEYDETALRALPQMVTLAMTDVARAVSTASAMDASIASGAGKLAQYQPGDLAHHLVHGRALV